MKAPCPVYKDRLPTQWPSVRGCWQQRQRVNGHMDKGANDWKNNESCIFLCSVSLARSRSSDCVCQVLQKHFFMAQTQFDRRKRRRRKIMRLSWKTAPAPSREAASGAPSARPCQDTWAPPATPRGSPPPRP